MYQKVMVPLDGSTLAEIALPYAEEITVKFGADLMLVAVSEPAPIETDHLYISYLEHMAERVQRHLEERGASRSRLVSPVLKGTPANEILRYAEENDVSLIAMASRGSSGQGPWILGSIAAKVLRATRKPVLLVRTPPPGTALKGKRLITKIMVPLDGSREGEAAIPHAQALARALGGQLVSFQVIEPGSSPLYPEADEHRRTMAQAYLDGIERRFQESGLAISTALVTGSPADQILNYAEENGVDLIALSTHGRSGIGRWVFGEVADKLIHAGNVPVLIVRATRV